MCVPENCQFLDFPCNSLCPFLSLCHDLLYIESWRVSTASALAMIAQPLDSGNHLFTGLAQILPPPHLPPHGNTGPSNPWWLPCTLRIKPSLSRGHTKTTVTSALTPSSLSLLAAPVTPFGPYQFLHALVLRRPRAVRRSLGAPGTTLCVCYSLALDSVSGSARILYRASIY